MWDQLKAIGSGVVTSAVNTAGERIRAAVPVSEDIMRPASPGPSAPDAVPATLDTSEDAMAADLSLPARIWAWVKTPAGIVGVLALGLGVFALRRRKR